VKCFGDAIHRQIPNKNDASHSQDNPKKKKKLIKKREYNKANKNQRKKTNKTTDTK
jgi:hypothetical protein